MSQVTRKASLRVRPATHSTSSSPPSVSRVSSRASARRICGHFASMKQSLSFLCRPHPQRLQSVPRPWRPQSQTTVYGFCVEGGTPCTQAGSQIFEGLRGDEGCMQCRGALGDRRLPRRSNTGLHLPYLATSENENGTRVLSPDVAGHLVHSDPAGGKAPDDAFHRRERRRVLWCKLLNILT